jgi:rhodanese-related sulfurtransferase
MEIIKQYRVVIMVVMPVLILVILRLIGSDHFKTDAEKLAESSVNHSNIITIEKLESLQGELLLINLGNETIATHISGGKTLNIPADSILKRNNLKTIQKHNGTVLLYSSDAAISARIWMVLSQMGINNIYILAAGNDIEVLKYQFRPDFTIKPEL